MVESVIQIKIGVKITVNMNVKIRQKTCICKNRKYLASVVDESAITCDGIIEETKTIPANFNEKI